MGGDFKPGAGSLNPAFLFHLGDVIYGPGKEITRRTLLSAISSLPRKLSRSPANHDGEVSGCRQAGR